MTKEAAMRLVRYINTAHVLCYTGIGSVYNTDNFLLPLNEKYRCDSAFSAFSAVYIRHRAISPC